MKDNVLFLAAPKGSLWVHGWTHYQMTGQTEARMNKVTNEVEIKDGKKWIKCIAGSHEFFTPEAAIDDPLCEKVRAGSRN